MVETNEHIDEVNVCWPLAKWYKKDYVTQTCGIVMPFYKTNNSGGGERKYGNEMTHRQSHDKIK